LESTGFVVRACFAPSGGASGRGLADLVPERFAVAAVVAYRSAADGGAEAARCVEAPLDIGGVAGRVAATLSGSCGSAADAPLPDAPMRIVSLET
jgi:hypothetical protein